MREKASEEGRVLPGDRASPTAFTARMRLAKKDENCSGHKHHKSGALRPASPGGEDAQHHTPITCSKQLCRQIHSGCPLTGNPARLSAPRNSRGHDHETTRLALIFGLEKQSGEGQGNGDAHNHTPTSARSDANRDAKLLPASSLIWLVCVH